MSILRTESISTRFIVSFISNAGRSGVSFLTGLYIAKTLGRQEYGNLMFLIGTFLGIIGLLDLGSSTAFYTFLSQKTRPLQFVIAYLSWIIFEYTLAFVVIAFLIPSHLFEPIWQSNEKSIVLLTLLAVFFQNSLWQIVLHIGESKRKTQYIQLMGFAVAVCLLLAHLIVSVLDMMSPKNALINIIATHALFSFISISYLLKYFDKQVMPFAYKDFFQEFWTYCKPLILYSFFSFGHEFADRWILHKFGGAGEQASYAIGFQFSAISMLAMGAIVRIFWKEVSESHYQKDYSRVLNLLDRMTRILFFVGCVVAGALMPWSEEILNVILGAEFASGHLTFSLMLLFPIHSCMGQLGSIVLFATENTKIQVLFGMIHMGLSMMAAWLLMAPPSAFIPGLGLASLGLAIKLLFMQAINVNMVYWWIFNFYKSKHKISYQIVIPFSIISISYGSRFLSEILINRELLWLNIGVCWLLYSGICAFIVVKFYRHIGLSQSPLKQLKMSIFP